jgi:hypothetical protein
MGEFVKYNLFIGRWSPFHCGHKHIIDTFLINKKPVCVAIRDSHEKWSAFQRKRMIEACYEDELRSGLLKVIIIPDIDGVIIGRQVGYYIVEAPEDVKRISGTEIRAGLSSEVPREVQAIIDELEDSI